MKKFQIIIFAAILFSISACSIKFNQSNSDVVEKKSENANLPKLESNTNKTVENKVENIESKPTQKVDNSSCYNLKREDFMVDKKQTFVVDFKPFEGSCFVTFHDPEFDNPPLGSQSFIYQNGKEVFAFPEQFGGGNTTCWVDAVAFEDVNNDQLKDVIIIGKCGAKSGAYNENMVYLNNGKEFTTNAESNAEMMDFSKISQIRDFVKKNPKMFVP